MALDTNAGDLTFAASAALPSNAGGAGSGGQDILHQLLAKATNNGGVMGSDSLTSFGPQSITPRPPTQMQTPDKAFAIPQGSFQTVGERKRADRQALFGGIASFVKSGVQAVQDKKTRALTMDIERLMSAMDGLKEAQASGNKEAMMKNAQIINDITSDPKKAKQISKAFNIDLMGGGKNKTENQALYNAYKGYQEKQDKGETPLNPNAQRLQASMPEREGLSPQAAAHAQAVKAGLEPSANVQIQAAAKAFDVLTKSKDTQERTSALTDIAKNYAQLRDQASKRQFESNMARTMKLGEIADVRFQADKYRADTMYEATKLRVDALKDMLGAKKGGILFGQLDKRYKDLQNNIKISQKEIADNQKELDKESASPWYKEMVGINKTNLDDPAIKKLNDQIKIQQWNLSDYEKQKQDLDQKMDVLMKYAQQENKTSPNESDDDINPDDPEGVDQ